MSGGRPEGEQERRYGRGLFLGTVATGLSALWWGGTAWNHISGVVAPAAETLFPVLPKGGWRIYSVADHMPDVDRATWRLSIHGLVSERVDVSFEELTALPKAEQISTFHCVTGWTVKNVHWGGVRIADMLALAKPTPQAH